MLKLKYINLAFPNYSIRNSNLELKNYCRYFKYAFNYTKLCKILGFDIFGVCKLINLN